MVLRSVSSNSPLYLNLYCHYISLFGGVDILTKVVLIVPCNPWGYMVEDIVSFAVKIARSYGINVTYTALYSVDETRAIVSINNKDIVYDETTLPNMDDLVDLIVISSMPSETLSKDYVDELAIEA